jgi:hypothetical protein
LSIALGIALALHATSAVVGYGLAHDGPPAGLDPLPAPATEIELVDLLAETRGAQAGDPGDAPGPASVAMSSFARMRERQVRSAAGGAADPANGLPSPEVEGGQGSYALDPSADATQGNPAARATIELGIGAGDWSRWVDPMATPSADPKRRAELGVAPISSTGGLVEALEARDQALGLGPAGAVLTAVHEAGYSEIAPALGTAIFSITVLGSGAVEVRLTGASSQAADWAKVGESIAASIRRKPPRIASTRIGVRLGIEVVAEERWPNGQRTRSDTGPHIAATPLKFQPTETAKEELLDRNPAAVPEPDAPSGKPPLQANFQAPGVFVQGRGKVCAYKVGLSLIPISGGCDPANIGQPARRVVSTRVISQTML